MGTFRVHVLHMKGVLPSLVRWAPHAGTRDFCPTLGCTIQPSKKYFFLTAYCFTSIVPFAHQAGHAVVLGRLSLICALANLVQYWYNNLQILFSLSGFRAFGAQRSDRPRERAGESEQKERLAQAADRKINQISSRYEE
jgi:hypothetical protein